MYLIIDYWELCVNVAIFNNDLLGKIDFPIAFICIRLEILYRKNATHIHFK